MTKILKRGFTKSDEKEFTGKDLEKLKEASKDLLFLINRGYKIKNASTFVGNHYLLSERQRLALVRGISKDNYVTFRKNKEVSESLKGKKINIDGFNTIITLEVAISNSLIIKTMDDTYRDLAGLRGTYKVIDKTNMAIKLIGDFLSKEEVSKVTFYLDAPVSNSGRLKERIITILNEYDFDLEVLNINNVDSILSEMENVVTSDAIILDKCISWVNLNKKIIEENKINKFHIDFNNLING